MKSGSLRYLRFINRTLLDQIPNGVYYVDELLLKTNNRYAQYLTYYMTDFVTGENENTDGCLLIRTLLKLFI